MAVTFAGGRSQFEGSGWESALADATKDTVPLPSPGQNAGRHLNVATVGNADEVLVSTPEGLIKGPAGQSAATVELGPSKPWAAVTVVSDGTNWHIV